MEESKYMKELSEYLNLADEAENTEAGSIFPDLEIKDIYQADYNIKKVKEIQEEIESMKIYAEESIRKYTEKVNQWLEESTKSLEANKTFICSLLRTYASEQLKDAKKKSLKLIEGTIAFKKQQDKFEYDENTIISFLQERKIKDFLSEKITVSVDKRGLKSDCTVKDGELYYGEIKIPGVTVTPQEDKFEIK